MNQEQLREQAEESREKKLQFGEDARRVFTQWIPAGYTHSLIYARPMKGGIFLYEDALAFVKWDESDENATVKLRRIGDIRSVEVNALSGWYAEYAIDDYTTLRLPTESPVSVVIEFAGPGPELFELPPIREYSDLDLVVELQKRLAGGA